MVPLNEFLPHLKNKDAKKQSSRHFEFLRLMGVLFSLYLSGPGASNKFHQQKKSPTIFRLINFSTKRVDVMASMQLRRLQIYAKPIIA